MNFELSGLVTYSASYFLPIILRDSLGFDVAKSQCLTAPVGRSFGPQKVNWLTALQCYVFSFLLGFSESAVSDKWNIRGHVIVFNCILEIIGIAVLGFAEQPYVRYFGAFLVVAGMLLSLLRLSHSRLTLKRRKFERPGVDDVPGQ